MSAAKTVRFWIWINDGHVRLTLRPGDVLCHCVGGRTDEGWSSEQHVWTHEGDHLELTVDTDGVDCDGRLSTNATLACPIGNVHAHEFGDFDDDRQRVSTGLFGPAWERVSAGQRDYSAEAAGY